MAIPRPLQDAAFGAVGLQMHRMRAVYPALNELVCDIRNEYPNFQWASPQGQCQEILFDNRRLPFGPSAGDVGPDDSHVRSDVDSDEAWFVTVLALCG